MAIDSNKKKTDQLGMPIGTASNQLRKQILFYLLQQTDLDVCFQCGEKIEFIEDLSIEHKIPWLDSEDPVSLFFDLDNIAFSHLSCNIGAARKVLPIQHGTKKRYERGCRCDLCKKAKSLENKKYRKSMAYIPSG